jgi:hypothetical protein
MSNKLKMINELNQIFNCENLVNDTQFTLEEISKIYYDVVFRKNVKEAKSKLVYDKFHLLLEY